MERERQQVRRATLCWEAYALVQRGDFAGAERKLADALTISTEEQKPEIKALHARCRREGAALKADYAAYNERVDSLKARY
jgi:hypothetical protein